MKPHKRTSSPVVGGPSTQGALKKEHEARLAKYNKTKNGMRIKVIYRKNLKMSEGKLAAQVAHAVGRLLVHKHAGKHISPDKWDCSIVVLGVSDKKFVELRSEAIIEGKNPAIQIDNGVTEIPIGTESAMAWIENE